MVSAESRDARASVEALARGVELLATEDVRMGGDQAELVRDTLVVLARALVQLCRSGRGGAP